MLMFADVWEGALDVDEAILRNGGVVGLMIRINDMNGGHHKDTNFDTQWAQAVNFLRAPYFVYNPWVDGMANFEWLYDHVLAGTTAAFLDVEVRPPTGYTTEQYADQVQICFDECKDNWATAVYTGGWFLSVLAHWPTGDYWWGRYPYYLCPQGDRVTWTWEEMQQRINTYGYNPESTYSKVPQGGKAIFWQCTGDKVILPGTVGRAMDVSTTYMTMPQTESWWGQKLPNNPTLEDRITRLEQEARLHNWNI